MIASLVPGALNLAEETICVLLRAFLDFFALRSEVVLKLVGIPLVVRLRDVVLPVVLNKVLEVFAVSRCWIRNVMIREPSLKLGFVPLVVCCTASC